MSVSGETILSIDNWLLGEAMRLELPALVEGLAHRLTAIGLPLDRFSVSFTLLNPSLLAAGIIWRPDSAIEFTRFDWARRDSGMYERSPFKVAHDEGRWLDLDLDATPDDRFGIIPELKAEGYKHYTVIPLPDSTGGVRSLTLATRSQQGFVAAHREAVGKMLPALAAVLEIKMLRATFRDVLGAYVGQQPASEIIRGTIHRGEISEVRAAILVADLRGFTHLSTKLPGEATADLINRYYDIVVPAVEAHGGEVLKFIGDAVLAIFPSAAAGDTAATLAALDAARTALDAPAEPFTLAGRTVEIRFGVAVHLGEAVFGNVGSGDRLDFTVIGRDVNVAARIASLCSRLGRNYLVSEAVAAVGRSHGRLMASAGAHEVRGIDAPLSVYVPDVEELGEEADDGVSQGLVFAPGV